MNWWSVHPTSVCSVRPSNPTTYPLRACDSCQLGAKQSGSNSSLKTATFPPATTFPTLFYDNVIQKDIERKERRTDTHIQYNPIPNPTHNTNTPHHKP